MTDPREMLRGRSNYTTVDDASFSSVTNNLAPGETNENWLNQLIQEENIQETVSGGVGQYIKVPLTGSGEAPIGQRIITTEYTVPEGNRKQRRAQMSKRRKSR